MRVKMEDLARGDFNMGSLLHGLVFCHRDSLGRSKPLVNKQRPFFLECFFSSGLVLAKVLSQEFILS